MSDETTRTRLTRVFTRWRDRLTQQDGPVWSHSDGVDLINKMADAVDAAHAETVARLEQQRDAAVDELADIQKLAKVMSIEDAIFAPCEDPMSERLRLLEVIAVLRVELLAVKSEPGLVNMACNAATDNLTRAQVAEAALAAKDAEIARLQRECIWTYDDDGPYHTQCGHAFEFIEDGPVENKAAFCQYCGGSLRLAAPVPERKEP